VSFARTLQAFVPAIRDRVRGETMKSSRTAERPGDIAVCIMLGGVKLDGTLSLPDSWQGIVLFAHGSGSSRHSPRNIFVARALAAAGFGTLLFDLLTPGEDRDYSSRFDIGLLGERLIGATRWLRADPAWAASPLGYFGASTGAAAALVAAAELPTDIGAVVSRGGRPDLAGAPALARVEAPTLLIVGGDDSAVIGLNQQAFAHIRCVKELQIVPGATHLFEEPGTLESVAALAAGWFARYLVPGSAAGDPPRA
jgi:putative phosphoribosyl transferase